jgi:quinoprotein glucose dehydrogenase
VRAESVSLLAELEREGAAATLRELLFDLEDAVRGAALRALAQVAPDEALPVVDAALERGGLVERRAAYDILAQLGSGAADQRLISELDRLEVDLVPEEVALDLVLAAELRPDSPLGQRLAARQARRAVLDPTLAPWLDTLHGGDPQAGRALFAEKAELACLRCHRYADGPDGPLGGQVGPDLRGLAERLPRLGLLESIVDPNRRIAEGYRSTVLVLEDDSLVEGRVVEETPTRVRLRNADDELVELETARIVERREGLSAMPTNLTQFLTREELRDLIAFLTTL